MSFLWVCNATWVISGINRLTDREILVRQHIFQFHSIYNWKGPLEQWFGDLEPDEIVVLLRRIAILGDLHHVESKLRFQMCGFVLRVPYGVTKSRSQLGIFDCDSLVDRRVAGNIGRIVC